MNYQTNIEGNFSTAFSNSLGELLQCSNTQDLWKPAVDIFESQTSVILHVYLPGVKTEGITIDFISNYLIIKGNREFPILDDILRRSQEIVYGSFERKVKLSIMVIERDNVNISIKQGVMIITINKNLNTLNNFRMGIEDIFT
jgi:HSP20 family molecular chaperone IbpA